MSAKIVFIYGLSVIIGVIVNVSKSGAFPAGPWTAPVDPDLHQKIEDLARAEREVDLRQNLHKHLKPFVSHSLPHNLKKPKPVEKPVTPYFVRILKRRPGSSKESAEDDSESKDIPKVLIDRRRNKDSPLPVLVVDEFGIPIQNETFAVENVKPKSHKYKPNPARKITMLHFQPVAEALKSEADTSPIPLPTTTTTAYSVPLILETVASPVTVPILPLTLTQTPTTESTTVSPIPSTTTTELVTTKLTSTTELTSTAKPTSTTIPTTTIELTSTAVEPQPPTLSLISDAPSETTPFITITDPLILESTSPSPLIIIPEIISTAQVPIASESTSLVDVQSTSFTTLPEQQSYSFQPHPSTPHLLSYADMTSTISLDSTPSFSTLAMTTLLPNGETLSTISQQDDQAVQASEIFSQRVPATTPISLSSSDSQLELTTPKPTSEEVQSLSPSSNTLSNEQIQLLMKTAIARLLLQGAGGSGNLGLPVGSKLPEVTIPQQVRLVENKPKTEEVVVFSPVSPPVTNKPTTLMPNIINALQDLISVTKPAPQRHSPTPPPPESQLVASNNNNNIFSPDGIFSRFFSTSRAATNNFAIVRASKPTTEAPTFFINLRDRSTSQVPPRTQPELVTSKYPILATPAPTRAAWQEFGGSRQNSQNNNPLRAILMAPANFMMGMFKAAQQIGAFMGNAFNTFATAFNPNRNRLLT